PKDPLGMSHCVSAVVMPEFVIGKVGNLSQRIRMESLGGKVFLDCLLVPVLLSQDPGEIVVRHEISFGRDREGVPPQSLTIVPIRYLTRRQKPCCQDCEPGWRSQPAWRNVPFLRGLGNTPSRDPKQTDERDVSIAICHRLIADLHHTNH